MADEFAKIYHGVRLSVDELIEALKIHSEVHGRGNWPVKITHAADATKNTEGSHASVVSPSGSTESVWIIGVPGEKINRGATTGRLERSEPKWQI